MSETPQAILAQLINDHRREWLAFAEESRRVQRLYAPIIRSALKGLAKTQGIQPAVEGFLVGLDAAFDAAVASLNERYDYDPTSGQGLRLPASAEAVEQCKNDLNRALCCYLAADAAWTAYVSSVQSGTNPIPAVVAAFFEGPRQWPQLMEDVARAAADPATKLNRIVELAGWVTSQYKLFEGGRLEQTLATEGPPAAVLLERIANDTFLALDGRTPGAPLGGRDGLKGRVERAIAQDTPQAASLPPDVAAADDLEMREAARAQFADLAAAVGFTRSETKVAAYKAAGLSVDEIVKVSSLARQTVENLLVQIRKKDPRARS
jgi:hypothetical protein